MRKVGFLFLLSAIFLQTSSFAAEQHCMARSQDSWFAVSIDESVVTENDCAPSISLDSASANFYRLSAGPNRLSDRVTCQWSWAGDASGSVMPGRNIPESLSCTLFLKK